MSSFLLGVNYYLDRICRSKWAPWIIFFVAIATRTVGALTMGPHSDDQDHTGTAMAINYLNGHGLSLMNDFGRVYSWIPPGMSLLDLIFIPLFGNVGWQARIFFVLMSAAANVSLFYVGKRLFEVKFAWLAAFWWAIYPPQWFWASRMNPQTYATNMLIFCLLLLFKGWEKRKFYLAFLIGIIWVTISLCRGEYALGIGVFGLASLFAFPQKKDGIRFTAVLLLGWIIGFSPWVIRNYRIHHRILLVTTNFGDSFWKAYNPAYNFHGEDIPYPPDMWARLMAEPNEVGRADIMKNEGFKFMRENPKRAIRNVVGNLTNFWRPWLSRPKISMIQNVVYLFSWIPLFILFVAGLLKIPWRDPHWLVVAGFVFYKWWIHMPFYIIVRYREAIMPIIALVAVYALRDYWNKFLTGRSHA